MSRRSSVPQRLEALRDIVALGEGRLAPDVLEEAEGVLRRAGQRLQLSSEHTVVALAGATGSGKSSLFNALAGADLSSVGVRRPTTAATHAAVWGAQSEKSDALLDWVGVPSRASVAGAADAAPLAGLVLLDLPDHDSTALTHRLEVDRLVQLVDLLVWVVDPQKYADAALHDRYLRRLASHDAVTVVVLNQVDRLDDSARESCLGDLRRLLHEDGLGGAELLGVSARTGAGLDALRKALASAVSRREAHTARISADLDRLADRLLATAQGDAKPGRVGRRERDRLSTALAAAAGVPAVAAAVAGSYRSGAIRATGWPFTRWLRLLRPDPLRRLHLQGSGGAGAGRSGATPGEAAVVGRSSLPEPTPVARSQVDTAVRAVVDAASGGLPRWEVEALRRTAGPGAPELGDALDRAVVGTDLGVSRRPAWWRLFGLLQIGFAVTALAGLGWLALIFAVQWLQLPKPPTYQLEGVDLPTVLLLGGVLAGLLLALLSRLLARVGAKRRRRRAEARLRARIDAVAESLVLAPLRQELETYEALVDRLARLR